jgi:hypothetical protein
MNPTFNPTLYNPTKNRGWLLGFLDPIFATIRGRIRKGRIGGHSLEFLGHPTSNPTSNPTPILPKKLLSLWALVK